ncbi:MAG: hypothetical protein OEV64_13335 [Desulfobulbaceae bacterium]|nr:hypothetical protein [Desulfobulbaceae bacterium]
MKGASATAYQSLSSSPYLLQATVNGPLPDPALADRYFDSQHHPSRGFTSRGPGHKVVKLLREFRFHSVNF